MSTFDYERAAIERGEVSGDVARGMLRAASEELGCPDMPWCQGPRCACAGEDDVCFPAEGIRALKKTLEGVQLELKAAEYSTKAAQEMYERERPASWR